MFRNTSTGLHKALIIEEGYLLTIDKDYVDVSKIGQAQSECYELFARDKFTFVCCSDEGVGNTISNEWRYGHGALGQ